MNFLELCARRDGLFLDGKRFNIKGASYFGMETDILVPHGLWGGDASTTLEAVAGLLAANAFNLVRLPLAASAVIENVAVDRYKMGNETRLLDAFAGRQLHYLDVLDYVVTELAKHRVLVLLDVHVLSPGGPITPLWYDPQRPATRTWIGDAWEVLARRYASSWNVVAADLKNEPHGAARWGSGDPDSDWRLAARGLAERVLRLCPRWLIFVEGVQFATSDDASSARPCFWGESLQDVRTAVPLELCVPERLVFSPHVYGPDVAEQSYFRDARFPAHLPSVWDTHFGFVSAQRLAPLVIGEWGGKYRSERDCAWQDAFATYLRERSIGSVYWCVNPNSGDTEGLLEADWRTPRAAKLRLLSAFKGSDVPLPGV
ncbi:hypothetical protein PybrP1_010970 [[Pythium] brassicae (nom. inval.)]|nr:hypothetical protein PybrP1_010970 [[Pythium] brassicae (nom. inval.)]